MTDPTCPRARDLGLPFQGTPGPLNAITDVPGVEVGFCTLTDPSVNLRSGVTAILPRGKAPDAIPVSAGHHALNGNGVMTGTHWIDDAGYFLGPILLSNTHAVGACHTAAVQWMIETYAQHFAGRAWAMPVVSETWDGVLNDINTLAITPEHGRSAIEAACAGPVAEGSSGGGNGMICYEFKAGTGTASRRVVLDRDYTVGVLVQANFGLRPWLNILGQPVGRLMPHEPLMQQETGSVIVVVATDAPLSPLSLRAVAQRAGLGIARTGTPGGSGSGDIFVAFSTANPHPMPQDSGMLRPMTVLNHHFIDPVYMAVVESVEEAVINAIVAGKDVQTFRPAGRVCPGIDRARLAALFRRA